MQVYVINQHGHPLMPCSPRKARYLLDQQLAKVIKRTPFTIQLLHGSAGYTQEVILGVDAGSKTIGLSASTVTEELFAAEVYPRNDVVGHMSDRRAFRRARRNRKTRYRKPRFNNRVRSKHKGWLAPSVEVKIQEHITAINRACALLPISKVVVVTAEFDLQLLKAIEQGKLVPQGEDYQKGDQYGHYNLRQYVLFRAGYKCECCGAHGKETKFHIHHGESRRTGGNSPDDLYAICEVCHERIHIGAILGFKSRRFRSTRDAAFMGIMRKTLLERLRSELGIPVWETRGYVTKYTREKLLKLPKSHTNDALAIAQGRCGFGTEGKAVKQCSKIYQVKPVRHHNRQLHKATINKGGKRKENQAPTYVKGFRLHDKVRYLGKAWFVESRRKTGIFLLKQVSDSACKTEVTCKKLLLLERGASYLVS